MLYFHTLTGQTYIIQGKLSDTIYDVKTKIFDQQRIPRDQQLFIFRLEVLKDDRTLSQYKVEWGSTLTFVIRLRMYFRDTFLFNCVYCNLF